MSGKASEVAARLGRSLSPARPPASSRAPVSSGRRERFTVDLAMEVNDALAAWASARKRVVGRRVPKTEVARVLIELLLADRELAARVEQRLKETTEQ